MYDPDLQKQAQAQVDAFMSELQRRWGLSDSEMEDLPKTIRWAIAYNKALGRWSGFLSQSIILSLVAAVLYSIWAGIVHLINTVK